MSELMQQKKDGLLQDKKLDPKAQVGDLKSDKQNAPNSNAVQEAIGSAMVTAEALNVRTGPGVSNSKIGLLKQAAKVEVLSEKDGWLQIRYNGEVGFISAAYTSYARKDNAAPAIDPVGSAQVTAQALNVRTGPGTEFGKLGLLKANDNVKVYGEKNGWLEIRLDGKVAYISAKYANLIKSEKATPKKEDEDKAQAAKKKEGPEQGAKAEPEKQQQVAKKEEPEKKETSTEHGSVIDRATVTVASLNVRAGADVSSAKIDSAKMGQVFQVIAKEGDWLKVLHKDGVAYIHGNYTMLQSKQPKPLKQPDFSKASPELQALFDKARLNVDEITKARGLIEKLPEEERGDYYEILQTKNVYHSQRDNKSMEGKTNIGDVMCNLTSLAMCLEQLGVSNPYPNMQFEDALEKIRKDNNFAVRTTANGWGAVAQKLGVNIDWLLSPGSTTARPKEFWLNNVRNALRSGKAVMGSVHGHIIRFQQVTDQGVVVDDPFGAMKLLKGTDRRWIKSNDKKSSENQVGEDHLLPFEDLNVHLMHWLVAFSK